MRLIIFIVLVSIAEAVLLHHSVLLSSKHSSTSSTIVLLHGLLGSSRNFNSFARTLYNQLECMHDIVVFDARNHGRSMESGPLPVDYSLMSDDVVETMQHLGLGRVHLIGHSMGGDNKLIKFPSSS